MRIGVWSVPDAMWRSASFTTQTSWTQAAGRAAIEQVQAERLSRLIAWTRRHGAFYREKWAGLPERGLRLADLPPVHKVELMEHFDDWVTDPAVTLTDVRRFAKDPGRIGRPFLGKYAIFSGSGTTGVPGLMLHDADALAVYDALSVLRLGALAPAWHWGKPLHGHRFALIAATEGHFSGVVAWERLRALSPWFGANARVFPVTAPIREIGAALDRFGPTVVASYATVLRALACEKEAGRLALNPSVLWYGGEWLAPSSRRHIERAFGCRVVGDYGASEFLNIAFECERGALHVNDDWVVLEPVDTHGRPVAPDTPSASVLLTSLANHVQPLVRYELGDSVTRVSLPCPCGLPFPVIRIDGRRDEILRLSDSHGGEVPVLPMALCTAVEEGSGVHRFQVVQTGPHALRLRVDTAGRSRDASARAKKALEQFLIRQGVSGVSTRLEVGKVAARPVSGKFRQVWRKKPARNTTNRLVTSSRWRAPGSRRTGNAA